MNIPRDDISPALFIHWYTPFWNSLTLETTSWVKSVEFNWCTAELMFVDTVTFPLSTHIGEACWLWHRKVGVLGLGTSGRSEFRGRNAESREKAMPPTGTVGPEDNHTPWEAPAVTKSNTRGAIHAVMWKQSMQRLAPSNNPSKCEQAWRGCLLLAAAYTVNIVQSSAHC